MSKLSLQITDAEGVVLAESADEAYIDLVYDKAYRPGERIVLSVDAPGTYLVIQLDDVMNPAFVYMRGLRYVFAVPFGEERLAYNPKAFTGELHLLRARLATDAEVSLYKNLAENEYDTHENNICYPHVTANAETRGESVFFARNAINGNTANHSHGNWPYESWGINLDPDAELTLDFGRTVEVDRVVLLGRADFPHDSWWTQAELLFSDGSAETLQLEKTDRPQAFALAPRRVKWLKLHRLEKDESNPSVFPALKEIQVFGTECRDDGADAS